MTDTRRPKLMILSAVAALGALAGACSPGPQAGKAEPVPVAPAVSTPAPAVSTSPTSTATTPAAAQSPEVTAAKTAVVAAPVAAKPATATPVSAPVPTPGPQTPPSPPARLTRIGGLPDTPGRATVQRVCSSCHSIGMVTAQGRTEDEWADVIGRMINNGLQASDDDLQTVHAYLSREFPKK